MPDQNVPKRPLKSEVLQPSILKCIKAAEQSKDILTKIRNKPLGRLLIKRKAINDVDVEMRNMRKAAQKSDAVAVAKHSIQISRLCAQSLRASRRSLLGRVLVSSKHEHTASQNAQTAKTLIGEKGENQHRKMGKHPLFDARFYLYTNPGIVPPGTDPLTHYREQGWQAGRLPHPFFDTKWYLSQSSELVESGLDPLDHYVNFGSIKLRNPHPRFNPRQYLQRYPEAGTTGIEALHHFQRNPDVDAWFSSNSDLESLLSRKANPTGATHVIFFSHEATRSGAPLALLNLIEQLVGEGQVIPWLVVDCLRDTSFPLIKNVPTIFLDAFKEAYETREKLLGAISKWCCSLRGPKVAFLNTSASLHWALHFKGKPLKTMAWIHELATVAAYCAGGKAKVHALVSILDHVAFNSEFVRRVNCDAFSIEPSRTFVLRLGVDHRIGYDTVEVSEQDPMKELGIEAKAPVIVACGTLEARKGVDIFVQVAAEIARKYQNSQTPSVLPHFVWVGRKEDSSLTLWSQHDAEQLGLGGKIHFVGQQSNPDTFFRRSSLFLLTSREEPVGLAALEALRSGVPVLAFDSAGGLSEYCDRGITYAHYLDVADMAQKAVALLSEPRSSELANHVTKHLAENVTWRQCAASFLEQISQTVRDQTDDFSTDLISRRQDHILIVSNGPPPVFPEGEVEGGGLRCWGLANGLKSLMPNFRITLAYDEFFRKGREDQIVDGIYVTTWRHKSLPELISSASTVIASYCMGALSVSIAEAMERSQILIWDCYVPIYVEICARQSVDIEREYEAFQADRILWNKALSRGDYFMCANQPQRRFYTGVLSALGRINPRTYVHDPLLIVPYGIYRSEPTCSGTPCTDLLSCPEARKVLWFGGIYPWFDLRNLMDAIAIMNKSQPTELIVVGASNPFVSHPDFVMRYEQTMLYSKQPHLENLVHFHPWIPFHERGNWYLDADITVLINAEGLENEYAWRTRLVDFIWGGLLVATNGGDPLSEDLFRADAAVRLEGLTPDLLASSLHSALIDTSSSMNRRERLREQRKDFYWDKVTEKLAERICFSNKIDGGKVLCAKKATPDS